jgi:hypothetical protein
MEVRLPQQSSILNLFYFILFYFIIILSLTFSQNWLISLVLDLRVNLLDKIEKRNLVPNMKHLEKFPTREKATHPGWIP